MTSDDVGLFEICSPAFLSASIVISLATVVLHTKMEFRNVFFFSIPVETCMLQLALQEQTTWRRHVKSVFELLNE